MTDTITAALRAQNELLARHAKAVALAEIASRAIAANPGAAGVVIADATAAFKRAIARAETLSDEFERVEFVPTRGPRVEFTGRMLAKTEAPSLEADVELEVWETRGGAFVAMRHWIPVDGEVPTEMQLEVVPPAEPLAMRLQVMEFFRWHQAARTMADKKLKWSLRVEVE